MGKSGGLCAESKAKWLRSSDEQCSHRHRLSVRLNRWDKPRGTGHRRFSRLVKPEVTVIVGVRNRDQPTPPITKCCHLDDDRSSSMLDHTINRHRRSGAEISEMHISEYIFLKYIRNIENKYRKHVFLYISQIERGPGTLASQMVRRLIS